jgi:hypothetical protein
MAVVKLDIEQRSPLAGGQEFGAVGRYEFVQGTAHFAVDPLHHRNAAITDIELGPRDANGRVCFEADFAMLQPVQPQRGNRRLFFDVCNRGRKTVMQRFNSAPAVTDLTAPLDPGNGFLMR